MVLFQWLRVLGWGQGKDCGCCWPWDREDTGLNYCIYEHTQQKKNTIRGITLESSFLPTMSLFVSVWLGRYLKFSVTHLPQFQSFRYELITSNQLVWAHREFQCRSVWAGEPNNELKAAQSCTELQATFSYLMNHFTQCQHQQYCLMEL